MKEKKYVFIEVPSLKKGRKIVSLMVTDNKGEVFSTEWKNTCDDKKLKMRINEMEKLSKQLDKKI